MKISLFVVLMSLSFLSFGCMTASQEAEVISSNTWDAIAGSEYEVLLADVELDARIRVGDGDPSIQVYFDVEYPYLSQFIFTGGVEIFVGVWIPLFYAHQTIEDLVVDGDAISGSITFEVTLKFSGTILDGGNAINLSIGPLDTLTLQLKEQTGLEVVEWFHCMVYAGDDPSYFALSAITNTIFPYPWTVELTGERFEFEGSVDEVTQNYSRWITFLFRPPATITGVPETFDGIMTFTESNGTVSEIVLSALVYPRGP